MLRLSRAHLVATCLLLLAGRCAAWSAALAEFRLPSTAQQRACLRGRGGAPAMEGALGMLKLDPGAGNEEADETASLSGLSVGDQVQVTGSDAYPKFFHVPGNKDGFVARGLTGTVEKLYLPGSREAGGSDHLDRSDERNVLVSFAEPKKWKAHFMPSELASPSAEPLGSAAEAQLETVLPAEGFDDCAVDAPYECDRVEDFMTPVSAATVLAPEMPMRTAAALLNDNRITGAPVASADGRLVGVLTSFDFLYRRLGAERGAALRIRLDSGTWADAIKKSLAGTVVGAMSKPVAVAAGADMGQVAGLMLSKRFNHVPVVDEVGILVGILTSQDVLRHVLVRLESDEGAPAP